MSDGVRILGGWRRRPNRLSPRLISPRLHVAMREARNDAVPFALAAAGTLLALALVSRHAD
jgi:hypothetical protein